MRNEQPFFRRVRLSLADLLGGDYVEHVAAAGAAVTGQPVRKLLAVARRKVDFYPPAEQRRQVELLARVGKRVCRPLVRTAQGATTARFASATKTTHAPLAGGGCYRVAEDGRLYFLSKSEHYHAPLGHGFAGYRLIEFAQSLGLPNATHNNTRGFVTRRLEEEMVRTANGLAPGDAAGLTRAFAGGSLNRVLNLETGSLAAEAGIKLLLARFYKAQDDSPAPRTLGIRPALIVVGDDAGQLQANYHGTTIVAQLLRGMWPGLRAAMAKGGGFDVLAVRPNNLADLERAFAPRRGRAVAGFLCELVMMNYGGLRLGEPFIARAAELCRLHDAPFMVDEIQTCLWHPQLYMFREYGLTPNIVVVGKGFPGGQYAASRIIFDSSLDALPQFGALVTNGQEELASLAYLVTMRWAEANAQATAAIGQRYHDRLAELAGRFPRLLEKVEGSRHLTSLCFTDLELAKAVAADLVGGGLDISVQVYKSDCPPAALTKLPLITPPQAADMVVARVASALARFDRKGGK